VGLAVGIPVGLIVIIAASLALFVICRRRKKRLGQPQHGTETGFEQASGDYMTVAPSGELQTYDKLCVNGDSLAPVGVVSPTGNRCIEYQDTELGNRPNGSRAVYDNPPTSQLDTATTYISDVTTLIDNSMYYTTAAACQPPSQMAVDSSKTAAAVAKGDYDVTLIDNSMYSVSAYHPSPKMAVDRDTPKMAATAAVGDYDVTLIDNALYGATQQTCPKLATEAIATDYDVTLIDNSMYSVSTCHPSSKMAVDSDSSKMAATATVGDYDVTLVDNALYAS
jgi:uncharacterized protein YchJ